MRPTIKPIITMALCCLLASLSMTGQAEMLKKIEYKYYQISPRAPHEIKPELMRNTPIREFGGSFNGRTNWFIDWNFYSHATQYGCKLTNAITKVRVVYILPALSEYVTDAQTIEAFNKFNDALTKHEHTHGSHGLQAAREIDEAFKQIPPQRNCRNLGRYVDNMANSIVNKYSRIDEEYDRSTRNGETEGAVIY